METKSAGETAEPLHAIPAPILTGLTACLAVAGILFSVRVLPPHWDQSVYQMLLIVVAAILFGEGAWRQRLILFDRRILLVVCGWIVTLCVSFFSAGMDKYYLSAATLNRVLWAVILIAAYLSAAHSQKYSKSLTAALGFGLCILAWKSVSAGETSRIVFALSAGLLFGTADFLRGRRQGTAKPAAASERARGEPRTRSPHILFVLVPVAIFLAVWAAAVKIRLGVEEIDLVRNNRQTEKALMDVAGRCFREHPMTGTGPGSIQRNFIRYRPVDATLRGVPTRLESPHQTIATIAAESGLPGLGFFLALISLPILYSWISPSSPERIVLLSIYIVVVVHDLLGGAWILTTAGAVIFFSAAGMLIAKGVLPKASRFPASFFVMILIVIGGIFLLQQIYWWMTYQVENSIKKIHGLIHEQKIGEAASLVDYNLVFLDSHRHDLISILVGGFHRAGMTEQALKNSLLLLQRDPDYPAVKNNIATFYFVMRRPQEAMPYLIDAVEHHPTTENIAKLGHLYVITGKRTEADRQFLDALNMFPREIDILLARKADLPDSTAQAETIMDAAKFAAHSIPTASPNHNAAMNVYQSGSRRLKSGLGMKEQ